jgi:hypothetical protein
MLFWTTRSVPRYNPDQLMAAARGTAWSLFGSPGRYRSLYRMPSSDHPLATDQLTCNFAIFAA